MFLNIWNIIIYNLFITKLVYLLSSTKKGAVYKGRTANGEGGGFQILDVWGGGRRFVKIRKSENC